jgi:hypothetical protein
MVQIYKCQACQDNNHNECEGVKFAGKDQYGGSLCNCRCGGMAVAVNKLNKRIASAQKKIKDIQSQCTHMDVVKTPKGSSGNYDPQDDRWWKECKCKICQKWWIENY